MNRQSPISTPGETHLTSPTHVDLQHGADTQGITAQHSAEPPCPPLALGAFKKNRLVPRLLVPLPKLLLAPTHGMTCEDTVVEESWDEWAVKGKVSVGQPSPRPTAPQLTHAGGSTGVRPHKWVPTWDLHAAES